MTAGTQRAWGAFFSDRMQMLAMLIVACFAAVLVLSSQSGASFVTYVLALVTLATLPRWNDVFQVRFFWLIVALVTYLTLSSLWSDPFEPRRGFSMLVRALLITTFVVAIAECQWRGQLQRWLGRALAVVGSLATIAAIVVFFLTNPEDGRLNGLGQLDTHVIGALVFGVVLVFVARLALDETSSGWRLFALLSAGCIVAAIVLSDSRNAWVSVSIGLGVYLLARAIPDLQRFVVSVVVLGLFGSVLLVILFMGETTRDLLLPRGDSFRLEIWSATVTRVIEEGPWFGLGILTPDEVEVDGLIMLHPHNLYLAVAFQGGIVGLGLFLGVLGVTLATLFASYAHQDAKLALGVLGIALPAYLLDGFELVDKIGSTWFLIWLPVAIALGLRWRMRPSISD